MPAWLKPCIACGERCCLVKLFRAAGAQPWAAMPYTACGATPVLKSLMAPCAARLSVETRLALRVAFFSLACVVLACLLLLLPVAMPRSSAWAAASI